MKHRVQYRRSAYNIDFDLLDLKAQDNRPDEAENESLVLVENILSADILQLQGKSYGTPFSSTKLVSLAHKSICYSLLISSYARFLTLIRGRWYFCGILQAT